MGQLPRASDKPVGVAACTSLSERAAISIMYRSLHALATSRGLRGRGGYLGRDGSIQTQSLIVGQGTHRGTRVGGYRYAANTEHVLHRGDKRSAARFHGTP